MTTSAQPQETPSLLAFYSEEEYQKYADSKPDRVILTYKKDVYDVTDFLDCHPGGEDIIKNCNGRNITDLFHSSYPHSHSKQAVRILNKYKIAEIKSKDGDDVSENTVLTTQDPTEPYPVITPEYLVYKDFRIKRNEGFIYQTLDLSKDQYLDFIHHAIHLDHTPLFTWKFFEMFTRNKWWYIPIAWMPLIIFMIYRCLTGEFGTDTSCVDKYLKVNSPDVNGAIVMLAFFFGMFLWSITEYTLHRFLFHLTEKALGWRWVRWFHFMMHGIHHLIPMDPDRLVFPPALGYVISAGVFYVENLIFGGNLSRLLYAGTFFAYILYDYQHWWLHHGKGGIAYFQDLKRYHNLHHFFDADQGYGITSKLWDYVFGTVIKVKEVKASA